jgi:hypothetical protein
MALLLTIDRTPLIYSGDEVALDYHEVGALFTGGGSNPRDLAWVQKLIALRRRTEALRRGDFTEIAAPGAVFGFARSLGAETVMIILNTSDEPKEVSCGIGPGRSWREFGLYDLIGDKEVKQKGSHEPLRIEALGARILKVD